MLGRYFYNLLYGEFLHFERIEKFGLKTYPVLNAYVEFMN
jgi:hypothetical protein